MSRSLLLVSYFYPPCPDTGAHRPAAMAKYLRKAGHEVTVLTTRAYGELTDDEGHGIVRTYDLRLARARLAGRDRVEPVFSSSGNGGGGGGAAGRPHPLSYLLVPEALVAAWVPFARAAALRLHRERRFDCVITTSPPESAHLVGHALQRRGVPWVADLRDGWNFQPLRPRFPTSLQRRGDQRLERRTLGAADAVTCVTDAMADDARDRLGARSAVVPSGFDPPVAGDGSSDDDAAAAGLLDPTRTSIVYTGRFGQYRRDPTFLIEAVAALAARDPDAAERLELVFAGPYSDAELELLGRDVAPARIVVPGTLPRERALALQRQADALLLIYAGEHHPGGMLASEEPAGSPRPGLGSAKLFEYLGTGKPILALAEGTEVGRMVAEMGAGLVVPATDPDAIGSALRELAAGDVPAADEAARAAYAYPRIAELMEEQVEKAIARRT